MLEKETCDVDGTTAMHRSLGHSCIQTCVLSSSHRRFALTHLPSRSWGFHPDRITPHNRRTKDRQGISRQRPFCTNLNMCSCQSANRSTIVCSLLVKALALQLRISCCRCAQQQRFLHRTHWAQAMANRRRWPMHVSGTRAGCLSAR